MEIERKFLVKNIPPVLDTCNKRYIEQAYLCTSPTVRVRRDNDDYYLTYKGKGFIVREEYNLPLTKESYEHLLSKADGIIITKTRYEIPDGNNLIIELDVLRANIKAWCLPRWNLPPKKMPSHTLRRNGSVRMSVNVPNSATAISAHIAVGISHFKFKLQIVRIGQKATALLLC